MNRANYNFYTERRFTDAVITNIETVNPSNGKWISTVYNITLYIAGIIYKSRNIDFMLYA